MNVHQCNIEFLKGLLYGFSWINNKTNHGYEFDINYTEKSNIPIHDYVRTVLRKYINLSENFLIISEKLLFYRILKSWLFLYLDDEIKLVNSKNEFSLNDESFRYYFIMDNEELFQRCLSVFGELLNVYGISDHSNPEYYYSIILEYHNHYVFITFEEDD